MSTELTNIGRKEGRKDGGRKNEDGKEKGMERRREGRRERKKEREEERRIKGGKEGRRRKGERKEVSSRDEIETEPVSFLLHLFLHVKIRLAPCGRNSKSSLVPY